MAGEMRYPYTMFGKFMRMPWKHHFTKGRAFRYWALSSLVCLPVFYKIDNLVNSPANLEIWRVKREQRLHDVFAPVTDDGKH